MPGLNRIFVFYISFFFNNDVNQIMELIRALQGLPLELLFLLYKNDVNSVFDKTIKIHFLNFLQYKILIILVLFLTNNLTNSSNRWYSAP